MRRLLLAVSFVTVVSGLGAPAYADRAAPRVPSLAAVARADRDLAGGTRHVSAGPTAWSAGGGICGRAHPLPSPEASTTAVYHGAGARRQVVVDLVTTIRLATRRDARHAFALLRTAYRRCSGHAVRRPHHVFRLTDLTAQAARAGSAGAVGDQRASWRLSDRVEPRVPPGRVEEVFVIARTGRTVTTSAVVRRHRPALAPALGLARAAVHSAR